MLMRIRPDAIVDADREGLRSFLTARRLHQEGDTLFNEDGSFFVFEDDDASELSIDSLDSSEPVTAYWGRFCPGKEEFRFLYDLCVAAGFLIITPYDNPSLVVVNHNHREADLVNIHGEMPNTVWVENPDELAAVFGGTWN